MAEKKAGRKSKEAKLREEAERKLITDDPAIKERKKRIVDIVMEKADYPEDFRFYIEELVDDSFISNNTQQRRRAQFFVLGKYSAAVSVDAKKSDIKPRTGESREIGVDLGIRDEAEEILGGL